MTKETSKVDYERERGSTYMLYLNLMNDLTRAGIFKSKDKGHKGHKDKGHGSESSSLELRQTMTDSKEGIRHMLQRERFQSV